MDLEGQLKDVLRRKKPPANFTSRVMQRINRGPRTEDRSHLRWRAAAAAIMLSALLGAWTAYEIAGERAREKVLLALHIAGSKVRYAQTQVHGIGH